MKAKIKIARNNTMKIQDFLSDGGNNISITVGINDLKEFGLSLIEEGRAMGRVERVQETSLTTDEVAEMLGVSKSTLWRWNKSGYLRNTRCGRKSFYKKSDVEKLIFNNNRK